jgi:hypothetical protein
LSLKIKILVIAFFAAIFLYQNRISGQVMGIEILDGKEKAEINFDYSAGFVLVKIKLNNFLPLNFIVDTGAEHIILFKKELADVLGLKFEKKIPLIGSDLETEVNAFITRNVRISLADTRTVKRDIIVLEENFLDLESLVGQQIDGILGSRFFRGLVIEIDYKKNKLVLTNFNKFKAPKENKYTSLDLQVSNYKPYINGEIITSRGERIQTKLLLDTGSALPFLLFLNTHASLQLPEEVIKGNLGRGLGGNLEGYMGIVKKLSIDEDISFNDIITRYQNIDPNLDPEVYQDRNGLIGNPILARFHVIFDFIQNKLYIKPRKNYNKKFKYDKSGMTIFAFGPLLNQYYVKEVIENSPAFEAGIKEGDIIKKVGLWSTKLYSLSKINKILQKRDGKKVKLVIERQGIKMHKQLTLRDLMPDK